MSTTTLTARNPLTGALDYEFPVSSRAEVAAACAAVRAAQPGWHALGAAGRSAALQRLADAFRAHEAPLFAALSADTGRRRIARIETRGVGDMIGFALRNAAEALRADVERPASVPGIFGRQQRTPIPVVGNIAPWNFPLLLSMIDTIPALMAGCAVVLKPSEVTPRYVDPLRDVLAAVPEIAAVTRIVRGPGTTGADLIDHVDAVVLTGSVKTGRLVAGHAARRFIPAFLELGGKDAAIVTRSADLDRAATATLRASIIASGQACQSLERVYVARAVLEPFLQRVLALAGTLRTTAEDPDDGQIGPFIMASQAAIVREHLADAVARGARVLHGGRIIERGGLWCEPTVIVGVDHGMKLMTEETFGPVMPIMPFDDIEQAIALANDSEYGLSANILTADEAEAQSIAERLNGGFVSINDVSMSSFVSDFEWEGLRFSGLGRSRTGPAGIERYLRTKAIVTNRGPTMPLTAMADRA